jgi:uncharacterized integral membrane protein
MAVALQNQAGVKFHFLPQTGEIPVVVLVFLTAGGVLIMGLLLPLLIRETQKRKKTKKRNVKHRAENDSKDSKEDEVKQTEGNEKQDG